MNLRMPHSEWLKSAAVAMGGGACAAISAALMDPTKFNLTNGLKDECFIAMQGALVGLAALFIRSPLGSSLMQALAESRRQHAEDRAALEQARDEIKSNAAKD